MFCICYSHKSHECEANKIKYHKLTFYTSATLFQGRDVGTDTGWTTQLVFQKITLKMEMVLKLTADTRVSKRELICIVGLI